MHDLFERYWDVSLYRPKRRYTILLSILLHAMIVVLVFGVFSLNLKKQPPDVFKVQLIQGADEGIEQPLQSAPDPVDHPVAKPVKSEPNAPEPEEAKPEPEPEKPKPEPEKPKPEPEKPKPEPEKPKPEPEKPKPEPEKPKPEKPKPEPEKPKPEPEKPKPEPEKPKPEKPKPEKPTPEKTKPETEKPKPKPGKNNPDAAMESADGDLESIGETGHYAKNKGPLSVGVNTEAADFPDALMYWATLVQRKVDKNWQVPSGVSLDSAETVVRVGFWVNRNGEVMETPVILGTVADPALGLSCVQAIKASLPLPPFPDGFNEPEQYVTYSFPLKRR